MSLFRSVILKGTRANITRPIITNPSLYKQNTTNNLFKPTVFVTIRNMASAPQTITEAIREDHSELFEYYEKLTSPGADAETQTRYQNLFVWELARHSAGEELVLYPAMEKYLGAKGKQLADQDREEHAKIKTLLKEWESVSPTSADFLPKLQEIWTILSPHNDSEEKEDLPPLESAIGSEQESRALGKSFNRTKMFVPTRAHPSFPQKPPFETAVGLLMAPIDKLTDAFRKFPEDED